MKKLTPFRLKRHHGCYKDFLLYRNNIRATSFCEAIANIFDKMV